MQTSPLYLRSPLLYSLHMYIYKYVRDWVYVRAYPARPSRWVPLSFCCGSVTRSRVNCLFAFLEPHPLLLFHFQSASRVRCFFATGTPLHVLIRVAHRAHQYFFVHNQIRFIDCLLIEPLFLFSLFPHHRRELTSAQAHQHGHTGRAQAY